MKKLELKELIKEEIKKVLKEEKVSGDVRRSFSFTYDDLKTAFEEGGENTVYDDMYGYSSSETFEEWFEKWFKKNYV
jgi:hypothetical protein